MDSKTQKSGSKTNLNESTLPLLEEQDAKGETPEKEKIEMEEKSQVENDEKCDEKKDVTDKKKEKKQKEKKAKKEKEKKEGQKRLPNFTQNFTIGLNVHDRDEKRINDHVNLTFEDIIAETDSNQGFEFIWRLTFLLFNFTRFWIYRILAAIIAVPLALIWALVFALVNVSTIWCCTPTFKIYAILLHYIHKIWSGIIRTILDPFFESFALIFVRRQTEPTTTVTNA